MLINIVQYPSKPKANLWIVLIKAGTHSPRYFHTTYPFENKPNDVSLSFQMSQINNLQVPWEDPSRPFFMIVVSREGVEVHPWASISGHFLILDCIGETFCIHLTSPSMWGKARVEFITNTSQKISSEIICMVVLVTNRVEEGSLSMVTTFCCTHDQAKVEPSEELSILTPCGTLPELNLVVVKIFANSPYLPYTNSTYLPWGSFGFPYLDVTTLAVGTSATQFLLAQLCLCRLLPFSSTSGVPATWEGWWGAKCLSIPPGSVVGKLRGGPLPVRSCAAVHFLPLPSLLIEKESSQTKEGSSLSMALMWMQSMLPRPNPQLEHES